MFFTQDYDCFLSNTQKTHTSLLIRRLIIYPNASSTPNPLFYSTIFPVDQFVSALNAFTVDARGTEKTGDGKVSATIKSPSGKKVNNFVENKNDGTYKVTYILPEEGKISHESLYHKS